MSLQTLATADGRTLAFEEIGDPAGAPILSLHGTPGCRLSGRHPDPSRVADAGVRLITYDRPGYGRSTRRAGRRIADCVSDVSAIAGALGLERFAVVGGSGGGPHALAVGAALPDHVTRVGCVVGVAPYGASGLDWFAGMDAANVRELTWALAGEATLHPELERQAERALARVDDDPAALLELADLSESDRATLADPGIQKTLAAAIREMFAGGVWGWVDDDLAFAAPWGFDLQALRVPVEVRYGAQDVLVPASHGAWLAAHVPGATALVDEGGGHLMSPDQHLEMLRALAVG